MNCPNCQSNNTQVRDSRPHPDGIFRRRRCLTCNHRFSTIEIKKDDYEDMKYIIERAKRNAQLPR